MIDLYYWPTPNGHKITMFLEEAELDYAIHPVGTTLEKFCADREERLVQFRTTVLAPLRPALGSKPFLGGTGPTYADYAVFGAFQWARATSPFQLLDPNDPVAAWRERMLNLYGGLARNSVGYPV